MPISSLPSNYGIGTFGKEAYKFADFLAAAGQKAWQLLPLGPLLRAWRLVRGVQPQVLVVQAHVPPLALHPAEVVDGGVGGQPVQPCGEARFPTKGGQPPPGGQECLLGHIGGVLLLTAHPQGQVVYLVLVLLHQLPEGVLIPGRGGSDQLLFSHADPS